MLYEEDKVNVVNHFNSKGYYDARVVRDSVWLDTSGEKPGLVVSLEVQEAPSTIYVVLSGTGIPSIPMKYFRGLWV